jgi:hypothetical protein
LLFELNKGILVIPLLCDLWLPLDEVRSERGWLSASLHLIDRDRRLVAIVDQTIKIFLSLSVRAVSLKLV